MDAKRNVEMVKLFGVHPSQQHPPMDCFLGFLKFGGFKIGVSDLSVKGHLPR